MVTLAPDRPRSERQHRATGCCQPKDALKNNFPVCQPSSIHALRLVV
jgi:hypothetical protein